MVNERRSPPPAVRSPHLGWGAVPLGEHTFVEACLAPLEAHLAEVRGAEGATRLAAAIERARVERMPLIDPNGDVTFLYLAAEGATVQLDGDLAGWNARAGEAEPVSRLIPMTPLPGTRVHTVTVSVPLDARIEYGFQTGDSFTPDPGARSLSWNGYMRPGLARLRKLNASFAMPAYEDEFERAVDPRAPRGTSHEYVMDGRRVSVYFPASEPVTTGSLPTLYMADGSDYADRAHSLEILDTLVWRGEIPPVLCVAMDAVSRPLDQDARGEDFIATDSFAEALMRDVVPFVDGKYPTDPSRRFVAGVSFSGAAMGALAQREPQAFAGALLQSPILGLMRMKGPELPPPGAQRWWIDMGAYDLETAQRPSKLEDTRSFVAALRAAGHRVHYREPPEGHNWTSWRARLPAALRALFMDDAGTTRRRG